MYYLDIRDLIFGLYGKGYIYDRYRVEKTDEHSEVYYPWEKIPEEVLDSKPKRWTSNIYYDKNGIRKIDLEILY